MFKVIYAVLFAALAGRVLCQNDPFNVTIGKEVFLAANALPTSFPSPISGCSDLCNKAQQAIQTCSPTDFKCMCDPSITASPNGTLLQCEQCMFTALVEANKPLPDVRAGQNQVLAGWTNNCAKNFTLATPLALALPPSWDGPFVSVFPEGLGIVIAAIGGILGSSLIFMLCNMC